MAGQWPRTGHVRVRARTCTCTVSGLELATSRNRAFACRWHVHSTVDARDKNLACSALKLAGARTHIELTWPNGPMVAVGQVRHIRMYNHKPVRRPNHPGGDNHREKSLRCGNLTSSLERHLCWHSDPPLDGESHKGARDRCRLSFRLRIRPHGRRQVRKLLRAGAFAFEMVENPHEKLSGVAGAG